jgi:hypothetical protein
MGEFVPLVMLAAAGTLLAAAVLLFAGWVGRRGEREE